MPFKLGSKFLVVLTGIAALVGCDVGRAVMIDMLSVTDTEMTDVMDIMPSTDTEIADATEMMPSSDEAVPIKLVWFVNYLVGRKADYLAWVAAVAPTPQAPKEVKRIASDDMPV